MDEEKGKAQFDKSKKVLTVTLPVLKPMVVETFDNNQMSPKSLVEECPISTSADHKELHNGHTLNGHLVNGHLDTNGQNHQVCSQPEDNVITESPKFNGAHITHEKDNNGGELNGNNCGDVVLEPINVNDLEDAVFDTKVLESMKTFLLNFENQDFEYFRSRNSCEQEIL